MTDYQKQGTDFLDKRGLEFRAVHIGHDCPSFCEDAEKGVKMDETNVYPRRSHIHGHHYHVTISRKGKGHFTVDYWNSYADEFHNWIVEQRIQSWSYNQLPRELVAAAKQAKADGNKRKRPTPYSVLACLTKYDPGTFEDFCSEYGYDTDSRKAETVYFAVQKEWQKMTRFFTSEEIIELQEIS